MYYSSADQENNNSFRWQSSVERKLCYREYLNKIEEIVDSQDVGLNTVKDIGNIIKQLNDIETQHNISSRYQHPDETLLDSVVLSSASTVLKECVNAVDVNTRSYNSSDFTAKILAYCEAEEEVDLLKFLPDAQQIIPQGPDYRYLYGTYDLQNLPKPKQKKERQKQEKDKFEKKAPEKLKNCEKEEQGIDEIVNFFYDVLTDCYHRNGEQPIKYYDYVVDTNSFATTVENMFYFSFLIRDGRAHFDLTSAGVPYIKPVRKRQMKAFRDQGGINSQMISAISVPEWETYKREGFIQKYRANKN